MSRETSTKSKIRFIDCDPIGHLNNSKYLDYMLNAREDHVEENYGITYEGVTKQTGSTWVTIMNEIAYLKEVRYNKEVEITSKIIEITSQTSTVEILMKDIKSGSIHAVLWTTVIFFNMKTRKTDVLPENLKELFYKFLVEIEQKDFKTRVHHLRQVNKTL